MRGNWEEQAPAFRLFCWSAPTQTRVKHGGGQVAVFFPRNFAMVSRWKNYVLKIIVITLYTWIISKGNGEKIVCDDLQLGQYLFVNLLVSFRSKYVIVTWTVCKLYKNVFSLTLFRYFCPEPDIDSATQAAVGCTKNHTVQGKV